jgi:hypothetical protein
VSRRWLLLSLTLPTWFSRTVMIPRMDGFHLLRARPTKLAQPVAELGRIDKTIHSLTYVEMTSPNVDELSRNGIAERTAMSPDCRR